MNTAGRLAHKDVSDRNQDAEDISRAATGLEIGAIVAERWVKTTTPARASFIALAFFVSPLRMSLTCCVDAFMNIR